MGKLIIYRGCWWGLLLFFGGSRLWTVWFGCIKMPYVVGCSFVSKEPFCKYAFSSSIVIQSQWQKTDDYPGKHAKRFEKKNKIIAPGQQIINQFCFPHPGWTSGLYQAKIQKVERFGSCWVSTFWKVSTSSQWIVDHGGIFLAEFRDLRQPNTKLHVPFLFLLIKIVFF